MCIVTSGILELAWNAKMLEIFSCNYVCDAANAWTLRDVGVARILLSIMDVILFVVLGTYKNSSISFIYYLWF